jgi:transposase
MSAPLYNPDLQHMFKNVEVSKKFGVSEVTVLNWIKASQQGRNNLEIMESKGKIYILDTPENIEEMQILSDIGRKYRNKPALKRVTIDQLEIRQDHYHELLHAIQNYKNIPFKVGFSIHTDEQWSQFYSAEGALDPFLLQSKLLIQDCYTVWLSHFPRNSELNLVFSGYSSPYTYRNLIDEIQAKRPIANIKWIFPSKEAEKVFLEANTTWLEAIPEEISYYTFVADIESDPMWSVLTKNPGEANVVFLLGEIFFDAKYSSEVIRNFNRTMTTNDLLVSNALLDLPSARESFDEFDNERVLNTVAPLLNELELYNGEDYEFSYKYHGSDPNKKWFERRGSKTWNLTVNKEIEFNFKFGTHQKTIIWEKDSVIKLAEWKLWDDNVSLEFSKLNYQIVSFNTNAERSQSLILAQRL